MNIEQHILFDQEQARVTIYGGRFFQITFFTVVTTKYLNNYRMIMVIASCLLKEYAGARVEHPPDSLGLNLKEIFCQKKFFV